MKYADMKKTVMSEVKKVFRPEFLNRLDDIIVFHQLSRDNMSGIIDILLTDLSARLAEKEMTIELSKNAREFLIEEGFDPMYGARPLKRAIQRNIEDSLSEELLAGKFTAGDVIKVVLNKSGKIKFKRKDVKKESDNYIGVGTAG